MSANLFCVRRVEHGELLIEEEQAPFDLTLYDIRKRAEDTDDEFFERQKWRRLYQVSFCVCRERV